MAVVVVVSVVGLKLVNELVGTQRGGREASPAYAGEWIEGSLE